MSNVSIDDSTAVTATIQPQPRGRPRKTDAKSPAERAKAYRNRLKIEGLKEVKCFLRPDHLAYLRGLCDIHDVTIADAVALALTAAMRGEMSAPSTAHELPPEPSLILLR